MLKKARGLAFIEWVIIIGVAGILAALLIPNANTAIQKSKQKGTMLAMQEISVAIVEYIDDHGTAPLQDGVYTVKSAFYTALCPDYVKSLPVEDHWGNGLRIYCGSCIDGEYGISESDANDFLIVSYGRYKEPENFSFDPKKPKAGLFVNKSMSDFENDLLLHNGAWIRVPKSRVK